MIQITDEGNTPIAPGARIFNWTPGAPNVFDTVEVPNAEVAGILNHGLTKTVADKATLNATAPDYVGQLAKVTRGGSIYRAYGTSAGNWDWIAIGNYTPPTATIWAVGTSYTAGDVVQIPRQIIGTAQAFDNSSTPTAWSAATTYAIGDIVSRSGIWYGAKQANNNRTPGTTEGSYYWGHVYVLADETIVVNDELRNGYIELDGGTGSGQRRRILYNRDKANFGDAQTREVIIVEDGAWGTEPDGTSTATIYWDSGEAIFEAASTHESDASSATVDILAGRLIPFVVEDYHYHIPKALARSSTNDEILLGPGDRADCWSYIVDHVTKLLASTTSHGAIGRWGSGFGRMGTIRWGYGTYDITREVRWDPWVAHVGPETPNAHRSTFATVRCAVNSIVVHGGAYYQCIGSNDGSAATEPGVGGSWTSYWRQIEAWDNNPANPDYTKGQMVSRGDSFYRCHTDHVRGTANSSPPSNGGTKILTGGNIYFRYWARNINYVGYSTNPPPSWAPGTFYTAGFSTKSDEFLWRGVTRGNDGSGHSVFFSGVQNLRLDANSMARGGIFAYLSQAAKLKALDIDHFTKAGVLIGNGSDSFQLEDIRMQRLGSGDYSSRYGIYFQGCKAFTLLGCSCTHVEVGLSFGDVAAAAIHNLELEHYGLAFEVRFSGEPGYFSGTDPGSAQGIRLTGLHCQRTSTNDYVVSSVKMGKIKYTAGSTSVASTFEMDGWVLSNSTNVPDRVDVELTNDTAVIPLRDEYGFNATGDKGKWSFHWSLDTAIRNKHNWGTYATTFRNRHVAINGPRVALTDDVVAQVLLMPGLYIIEVEANPTNALDPDTVWFDGGNLTVRESPGGVAIPGLTAVSIADSTPGPRDTVPIRRWYWHPGGEMEYEIAGTTNTGSASIYLHFRPLLGGPNFSGDALTMAIPS